MTTQPFLVAPFLYPPLLSNEQTAFRPRKIKYVTNLVGFQVHTVYTLGELPRQAYPHLGWNYSKACTLSALRGAQRMCLSHRPQPHHTCEENLTRIPGGAYIFAGSSTFGSSTSRKRTLSKHGQKMRF